jgi:hypothetical protein
MDLNGMPVHHGLATMAGLGLTGVVSFGCFMENQGVTDDFMEHPLRAHSIDSPTRKSFHPFRDIVDDNQDVFVTF